MKTKFLSLFLSLIMVLSCFAAALPAFAEGEEAGSTETTDYDALAVAAGYVARVGTPEKAYADGAFTGYYKFFASVQKGYTPGAGEYANAYDAAVAALQNAEATAEDKTVYMLADVEITNTFKMGAGITVDGNGYIISGQYHQKIVEFNSTDAVNVATIKNWFVWQRGQHGMVQLSPAGAVANIENCYLLGTGVTTGGIIINAKDQTCTVKNTTIKIIDSANVLGLGAPTDTGVRINFDNQHVTMENCVIDCSENFGGTALYIYNNDAKGVVPAHNSIVLTNCIGIGQYCAIYNRDVDLTINGGTYITTLGASAYAAIKLPVLNEDGTPVYDTNEDGTPKVDEDGNPVPKTTDKMEVVEGQKNETTKVYEYTAFEGYVINKDRGGNITFNGTVKLQGGKGGILFNAGDLAVGTAPVEGVAHNVTAEELAYAADMDYVIWRDATEAAKFEEGYVAYTFNDDGTKTYYKNLSPVDADYVAADGSAMESANGKTIYLISDIDFLSSDDKSKRVSDFAIGGTGSQKSDINGNAAGFVAADSFTINGMGYSINMQGYLCTGVGAVLNISNATITTTATGRHMIQANATSTVNLTNVDLVANCALDGGFIVARATLNFNDVTFNYTGDFGANATHMIHQDQPATITFANCRMDLSTMAPKAGFLQALAAGTVVNFTGNTNIKYAKYGVVNAKGAGSTVNVEDRAVITSLDNAFVMQDENDVINVKDYAQVVSTAKDGIKLVGKNSKANISGYATVTASRNVINAHGEGTSVAIAETAAVTLNYVEGTSVGAVVLEGKNSVLVTSGTITAAGVPAIKTIGEGADITVKAGTINGTVNVGAKAAITTFGGTIDAGAATTEAIIVAADAIANIYEGVVKGGTAPVTGDTYAAGTTEKTYNELSSKTPVFQGISLRMNADSEGMRFTTTVSAEVNAYAQSLIEAGLVTDYNYGTFIVRATELENAECTISAFTNAGIKYAAITADEGLVVNSDGSLTYTAGIANFKMKNYGVTLVARAYVAYTLTDGSVLYIYGEAPTADDGTNLANMAKEALGDVKMAAEEGYMNKVESYYEKDAKGKWKAKKGTAYAPYSKAQQALLNLYIEEA